MTLPQGHSASNDPPREPSMAAADEMLQAEAVEGRPGTGLPLMPVVLFLATCYTTYQVGELDSPGQGYLYAIPLMLTLLCHEFGHYLQSVRYGVPASLPYFIPMPAPPLGTMGAVIGMRGNSWNRKELFDIGISGPLAGLVPAIIFCVWGLSQSTIVEMAPRHGLSIGAPLLFGWLAEWILGPLPTGFAIELHPMAYAGWVGIFITALNLMPISQLDGGHVLYALLLRKAHIVATLLLGFAILFTLLTRNYQWWLMLVLLLLVGPNHPPTADDNVELGTPRIILGWLTLAFLLVGFTPTPFR
jgi:membrane-associated protease RseP (regulator of RpoE activity)